MNPFEQLNRDRKCAWEHARPLIELIQSLDRPTGLAQKPAVTPERSR